MLHQLHEIPYHSPSADIKASKTDILRSDVFLIQVKHHEGTTGSWGQQQLSEIKNQQPDEYGDYQLVLITSGIIRAEDKDSAKKNDITLLDGNDLAEWLFSSIDKLHPDTRHLLGISQVPQMLA